jgi:Ca2+-binding EF-hand superfamily protein
MPKLIFLIELRVAFNIFDVDHSGDISKQEYNDVICKLGFGPHINEYMKLFGDENHKMDFEGILISNLYIKQ